MSVMKYYSKFHMIWVKQNNGEDGLNIDCQSLESD